MAHKRMFSKDIVSSDAFLDMPLSSQLLYFHIGMEADDDGFVSSPKRIMRMIGCQDDDLKVLISKKFLIPFQSGVCVIKHWKMNNFVRKDRYIPTVYADEMASLSLKENKSYKQLPSGVKRSTNGQPSIVKNSIVENRIEQRQYGEFKKVLLTDHDHKKLIDSLGEDNVNALIFELDTYMASKGKKYKSHYATILSWARRKGTGKNITIQKY